MNTLFFLRFGNHPLPEVTQKIIPFFSGQGRFMEEPGCLITIFKTEATLEQVHDVMAGIKENVDGRQVPINYFLFNLSNPDNIEFNFSKVSPHDDLAQFLNTFKSNRKRELSKLSKDELQQLLQECIELEEYEKAAEIKNYLTKLGKE